MKFIFQVLATVALAASVVTAFDKGIMVGNTFGGPHGDKYSDLDLVDPGQTVKSITVRSADRVDSVSLDVVDSTGQSSTLKHGGDGGDENTLTMGNGEHITGVEGNSIKGGTPQRDTDNMGKDSASDGYQLGGFAGFAGNELDSVGAIWTNIKPVE
ncbi:Hypothetical protein PHPALM_4123 [Phytophthora palmivora]|uniref:Jacalin-type lectin domain-containing protein n=1 Tax=Phytophthora palmivora TaxID=4796 RepID=A0A2P4YKM4_9STRA|nr:Hypothetical protein PHPALM_4123 [Phytophthora palmivora]